MNDSLDIVILGATGSIGRQTLEVIKAYPEKFRVIALGAHSNVKSMFQLVRFFKPQYVAMSDTNAAKALQSLLAPNFTPRVLVGAEGLEEIACLEQADLVVGGIAGCAGLGSILAAVRNGKRVALANKEPLVMAGELIMSEAHKHGATILPVDSEHAATAQLMEKISPQYIRRIILTASGGPFLGKSRDELKHVRASDALAHPNWRMGPKITIDSATGMNKGFEIIEAHWLFDLPPEQISVLVHPESRIHSLVELQDGSLLAHLSEPDMRLAIAYALSYPDRLKLPDCLEHCTRLNLTQIGHMTFKLLDENMYSAVELCYQALESGKGLAAGLAGSDEVVVDAFLHEKISFVSIVDILTKVAEQFTPIEQVTLDDALAAEEQGREIARACIARKISN